MKLPMIQIRQQAGKLAFVAEPATMDIRQPRADVQMNTTPARMVLHNPIGDLRIDQSKAWDALGVGPHLEAISRVYSRSHQLFFEHLAQMVEEGNQMMDLTSGTNPIADIARQRTMEGVHFDELNFVGPASYDNVDINYVAREAVVDIQPAVVNIQVQVNRPQIDATRGRFNAYMEQWPKIEIIPPQLDILV